MQDRITPRLPRPAGEVPCLVDDWPVEEVLVDAAPVEPVAAAVAAAFDELPEEPPQAVKPRQASIRIANMPLGSAICEDR
jgi:hypothetical protein